MATPRPDHLDLEGISSYAPPKVPFATMSSSHSDGAPSPRASDIPPAMSPLDALAYQGRLLAKRFEEENKKGSRLSRLPPTTIKEEFALARPGYFRSLSAHPQSSFGSMSDSDDVTPRMLREVKQDPETRPQSHYPVLQSEELGSAGAGPKHTPFRNQLSRVDEPISESPESNQRDYFNIPRSHSPEQIESSLSRMDLAASKGRSNTVQSNLSVQSAESTSSGHLAPRTPHSLAPPKAPVPLRGLETSPSIRAVIADASEDSNSSILSGSIDSLSPHKPPFATISRSQSPASPFTGSIPRSPSIASEQSYNSQGLPRPSLNFSRPISRGGPSFDIPRGSPNPYRQDSAQSSSTRPSLDLPNRQDSADTPGTPFTDAPQTPVSLPGDDLFLAQQHDAKGGSISSYTYSKYSLPRGKLLKRESINPQEFIDRQFEWDGMLSNDDAVRASSLDLIPSPPPSSHADNASTVRPLTGSDTTEKPRSSFSTLRQTPPKKVKRPKSAHNNRSASPTPDSLRRPKSSYQKSLSPAPSTIDSSRSQTSTIKAHMDRDKTKPPSTEFTAEGHLEKGIECHEAGKLQESTYHLRLAAKAGHPTGMLLFALACRHGWGMRPSPSEGVAWLQKAVDSSQLEVAEDEDLTKKGKPGDLLERKSHKAQFALSVYELGVSYMNGWGVKVDKALAVRCFEIAGNWGDVDALAEAGFCYTEGVGVKKDLKKAASFYRKAEAKGMSMAGNSWIYKEKYMEDSEERLGRSSTKASKSSTEKKSRNKSRTRGIFSRKKSFAE